jgi:hypothetical protein
MVMSPNPEGVPIFARFNLGGILDLRGFELRSIGPRLPLRKSLDENSPPFPNGYVIGGNLMYYQNLEFEFPILEAVNIRGVVFTDLGNAWNLEGLYCESAPAWRSGPRGALASGGSRRSARCASSGASRSSGSRTKQSPTSSSSRSGTSSEVRAQPAPRPYG